MKRYIIACILSVFVLALYADEETDFYLYQFNNAKSVVNQLSVVKAATDPNAQQSDDAGSLYANALHTLLLQYPTVKGNLELDAADDTAELLAHHIGLNPESAKSVEGIDVAQDLWKLVQDFKNPVVRATALVAIGKTESTNVLPEVIQLLKDLNSNRPVDKVAQLASERVAYGAIQALELLKDPDSYIPVFFASNGWYGFWVLNRAKEALPNIGADSSAAFAEVISNPAYTYAQKYLALRSVAASSEEAVKVYGDIPSDVKSAIAGTALSEAWRIKSSDPTINFDIFSMRKLALTMLAQYGTQDDTAFLPGNVTYPSIFSLLERSFRYGIDEDEQFKVIEALKKIGSDGNDQATAELAYLLNLKGTEFDRGAFTNVDERLIRAIIPAVGYAGAAAGQDTAKVALRSSLTLNWSPAVRTLLNETYTTLGK